MFAFLAEENDLREAAHGKPFVAYATEDTEGDNKTTSNDEGITTCLYVDNRLIDGLLTTFAIT